MSGLTPQQLEFFHAEGYLHVPAALRPEDLDPVQAELEEIIDRSARRLCAEGKIDSDYAALPFAKRLIPLGRADDAAVAGINFPANLGRNIFDFLHNPRLLDLVEALVGPEIYANSCQHIRPKLPATNDYAGGLSQSEWARSTAWHQDLGVLLPEADDTLVVTTWIPLVDANRENGALMVLPRCHREPLRRHVKPPAEMGGNWMIDPVELPPVEPVAIPVRRGGLLAIHCPTAASRTGPTGSAGAWICAGTMPANPTAGRICPACWCAAARIRNWWSAIWRNGERPGNWRASPAAEPGPTAGIEGVCAPRWSRQGGTSGGRVAEGAGRGSLQRTLPC